MNVLTRRPSTPVAYVLGYSWMAVIVFAISYRHDGGLVRCVLGALLFVAIVAGGLEGVPRLARRYRNRSNRRR